ncbi:tyrosine-type recombinase/integrase [Priestia filamentosa]|uniref:tyrosine-type recombinase/integrase n=1 Tax=Priestia filamentosa TaxID=1402861 RepID=UPI000A0858E1|nr:tyrosine-type recombinase/integrase [Priestia filamentosa]OXS72080.1 hypothetical protein B1B01_07120 [Priestia filamentosa]SMF18564.1 Site-specific recombinase XerD [Priestia filamentosa]
MKKTLTNTYNLKVEKALKSTFNDSEEKRIQYYITEDDLPLYEVNRWLELVSINSFKSGENYAYKLLSYLRFLKGKYQIHYKEVYKKNIIVDYIKYLLYGDEVMAKLQGKRSWNSISEYISVIKSFYDWLEDEKEIDTNPVTYGNIQNKKTGRKHMKKKLLYGEIYNFDLDAKHNITNKLRYREKRSHLKWYTEKEIKMITDALSTRRDKLVFQILVETGTRIGECLGLRLHHHDMHEGILMIRKSENVENKATVKTNERDLYITDTLNDEILEYIRSDRNKVDITLSDYLFLNYKGSNKGQPLEQKNFLKILKRAGERAGLDPRKIITHAGRSTRAQHLLDLLAEGKITEGFITQEMGWASIDTLKQYVKGFDTRKRIEVAKNIKERRIKKADEKNGEKQDVSHNR